MELLYDTLVSKRTRSVSIEHLEPIILRFVDLAVDLNKPKIIRDGLYQYKKLVQATSISSLEKVISSFIELSENKVAQAQAKADKITLDADDDLEATESPENILLSTVSAEQTKDRTDREVVTPWLKLLWEAYRISLDALRNNSKIEVLYQSVVTRAFDFCVNYSRKTEFRRLCEILRLHLANASQIKNSAANSIDLSDPDTLQRFLDTRFRQLNVAVQLELWQEAFRSVEDVHTLLNHTKRPIKPHMMANYYENLARIFLVSDNYLFHATAWSRYWSLLVTSRNAREQDLSRVASLFLISTLAIPTFPQYQIRGGFQEDGDQRHRNSRLTNLLNLTKSPTRDALLKQALSKNVLSHVLPEIRALYNILEVDFHPLGIKKHIVPIITKVSEHDQFKPYFRPLYDVILTRVFQQLSQVYETVRFDFLIDLATFPAPFDSTPVAIEKFIVRGCHKGEFNITIDHESRSITFRDDIYDESSVNSSITRAASSLQLTPSSIVRTQISRLGSALFNVINKVDSEYLEERTRLRQEAIDRAIAGIQKENDIANKRLKDIEARQQQAHQEQMQREEEETKARIARLREEREAEQRRLAEDATRREIERRKQEEDALKEQEKIRIAQEINAKGVVHIDISQIKELDSDQIREIQIQKISEVTKELQEKLESWARELDYSVRAIRLEEQPKWKEDAESQLQKDKKLHEHRYAALLVNSKRDHEVKLALKKRLSRLLPEYQTLKEDVHIKHKEEFEQLKQKNAIKLEAEKAKRVAEVKARIAQEREQKRLRDEEEARKTLERNKKAREAQQQTTSYVPPGKRATPAVVSPVIPSRSVSGPAASAPPRVGSAYVPRSRGGAGFAPPTASVPSRSVSGMPTPAPAPAPASTPAPGPERYNAVEAARRRREARLQQQQQ